jgi:hypothetical protein
MTDAEVPGDVKESWCKHALALLETDEFTLSLSSVE